jgi:hypothetical protein
MKNNKDKTREPFPPEKTPTPPDHSPDNKVNDPNNKSERNEKPAIKEPGKPSEQQKAKPKLLGESETEITDETTI